RPADDAPDVGLAVAPLGDEDLRRLPAVVAQLGNVGLLQLADQLAVVGAAQLVDGRQVHARVGVDEVLAARRELRADRAAAPRASRASRGSFFVGLMVAVPFGQRDQTAAVEVDAVVVDEVRVLVGVLAAGPEPDLPLILVDAVHAADDVVPFGDLVL